MARVNISKQLKAEVTELCAVRARQEREALNKDKIRGKLLAKRYNPDDFEHIYYNDAPHLYGAVPESWLIACSRLHVHVLDSSVSFIAHDRTSIPPACYDDKIIFEHSDASVSRHLLLPCKYQQTYKLNLYVSITHPMMQDEADQIRQSANIVAEMHAVTSKWNDVNAQVGEFLDSMPSLNAALKKWEGLAHFIPDKYLRKVDEPVAKRVASTDADAVQIDTTRLEVVAVTAKLTGA